MTWTCSECCPYPPCCLLQLPDKAALEDLATSDTYSSVAAGRRALTQSMANAAAKFCDGSVSTVHGNPSIRHACECVVLSATWFARASHQAVLADQCQRALRSILHARAISIFALQTVEASVKAVAESVVKLYTAALVKTQTVLKVQGNGKGCVKAKAKLDVTGVSR